ncbi:hypothetical protein T4D_14438 [Trichinella pseudospiralis]|uniref:Uncharacterized protein n=1 Tax=Trichinella pseudospiralis TaxID=6337 RepID=A0A0V1FP32_TRIPS|nr:hypothetical protein T4D_14438 [Trichinella pseudospiralis]
MAVITSNLEIYISITEEYKKTKSGKDFLLYHTFWCTIMADKLWNNRNKRFYRKETPISVRLNSQYGNAFNDPSRIGRAACGPAHTSSTERIFRLLTSDHVKKASDAINIRKQSLEKIFCCISVYYSTFWCSIMADKLVKEIYCLFTGKDIGT